MHTQLHTDKLVYKLFVYSSLYYVGRREERKQYAKKLIKSLKFNIDSDLHLIKISKCCAPASRQFLGASQQLVFR